MADDKYNIEIAIKAQTEICNKIVDGISNIEKSLSGLKKETTATSDVMSGAFLNVGAQISNIAMKLPSAVTSAIRAFGEEEVAINKLSAAIRSQGGNVSEVLPIMQQFASEMQKITTYGDEQILAMQGVATSMGVSSEQMETVMQSAIGLSAALGMDVATATKAASAAIQGKTELLTRYIPMLSECKTSEEKFAKVQELSRNGFAQAKAEGESTLGKLKQAANAWGDLAEVAGKTFAPVAIEVANALKFVCETLSANSEIVQVFIGGLSSLAVGFAFSKIGGLANVVSLFKMVSGAINVTKAASDALNFSLKMNPLGIAVAAVTGFAMVVSHLSAKEKERYNQNIEKSKDYRAAIDGEIESLKQWGVSIEDNKKRTAEISAEIAKLKKESEDYQSKNGQMRGAYGGVQYKVFSKEEQSELDNYRAKIEKLEAALKAYAPIKELAATAEERHKEVMEKSAAAMKKFEREMLSAENACIALKQTRQDYAATEKEIAKLQAEYDSGAWGDSERVAKILLLGESKKKLIELAKQEKEQMMSISSVQYESLKTEELKKQYNLETQLAAAKIRGNTAEAESFQKKLDDVSMQQKRLNLVTAYIDSLKSEIKTQEDLQRIKSQAAIHANAVLEAEKKAREEAENKAATETWLNAELEKGKDAQRGLEWDILKARSQGNEADAASLEGKLRIAQLSAEIFENTRKEGMTRAELETLTASATRQAQERYEMEKSVTDEVQRHL